MTLTDAFIRFDTEVLQYQGCALKTRMNYRSALNSFVKCNGDIPVQIVGYGHLVQWKHWREHVGHSPSSISGDISRMRQVFKYLRRLEIKVIDPDLLERPKAVHKPPVWLTSEEVARLLSVIDSLRDKALIACLFDSGARISELLSLNRDSIINGEAEITGKGGKVGTLRFSDLSLYYVQMYVASRNDSLKPLFISGQSRRISHTTVAKLLHEYADAADIDKNVTPHVLRHSFATDLRMNGADIYEIKEQLRHSNISSTQLYVHIEDKSRKEGYSKYHSKIKIP